MKYNNLNKVISKSKVILKLKILYQPISINKSGSKIEEKKYENY
jgi:hypothetical protein